MAPPLQQNALFFRIFVPRGPMPSPLGKVAEHSEAG